ncbi:DHA2 family efflux MFS transporter permease subunit [Reyranella sp. CPCC 100927]|uniref:DHA2 family efflux MFS transporter permease subunit n=1 Tax=Reyranella sp. CPCC 100927 TaxID=2599616 RepID=UPI0011B3C0B4|nr:DHA2 family efflux MFS transporter permease subunit [Reyranella sp. CPCC 100927]TWT02579.1 DHA2 family efflux MFS transporter permease subunit [Reyranella sp. CPCC 100927]
MTSPRTESHPPSPWMLWAGFAAMCLGMFMAILDIQVVATSLPNIQSALTIAPDQMSWIQTSYLIAEVIAIPLTGWLTRVLGMRGLFVVAVTIFTLASVGCAASTGFGALVAWRVVQGFAGGTLIPAVFSAVFLLFPARGQALATTIAGVIAVLAPTLGPVVGGWITETYSWHWLFLINVVPGVIATLVGGTLLPRQRVDRDHVRTLDGVSLILMAVALGTLEIALKEAPSRGWTSPLVLGLLLLFAATGTSFVRRTLRSHRPVVDLRALADRDFAIGCWLSFMLGVGLYGSVYLMPVFLGFVRQHGPLRIGEIMLVTGILQLLTAPLAVALERRIDARWLTAAGFTLFAVGLGMSCFQTWETDFDEMFWPQVVRGSAIMLCLLPPTRLALGHLPPARVPDASGLFNLMRNLGGAIGLALIDTVLYGRAPVHAERILARLAAGDLETAHSIGLPAMPGTAMNMVQPLIERAGFVTAANEAWAMLAAFTIAGVVALPFARQRSVAPITQK